MEAPQVAKSRKMIEALKLIRESRDSLFSQDLSEVGKKRTKKAWEDLLQKTTNIGWTNCSQTCVTLKRKWNALSSETQKSIRTKYEKAEESGVKATYSQKEEVVIQILNLDVEISPSAANSSISETSIRCTPNLIETPIDESVPKKPTTRSQQKLIE